MCILPANPPHEIADVVEVRITIYLNATSTACLRQCVSTLTDGFLSSLVLRHGQRDTND